MNFKNIIQVGKLPLKCNFRNDYLKILLNEKVWWKDETNISFIFCWFIFKPNVKFRCLGERGKKKWLNKISQDKSLKFNSDIVIWESVVCGLWFFSLLLLFLWVKHLFKESNTIIKPMISLGDSIFIYYGQFTHKQHTKNHILSWRRGNLTEHMSSGNPNC